MTGTVYNDFLNKDEILLALTEEFGQQTLLEMKTAITADSFCGQLQEIYAFLKKRIHQFAEKLMNSLENAETAEHERMASMQPELESAFIQRIEHDEAARKDIWNETFTKEQFARFIMSNMLVLFLAEAPNIAFFIIIIKRTIY